MNNRPNDDEDRQSRGGGMAALLPGVVECDQAFGSCDSGELGLFPEEAAQVAGAVDKRRQEFAAVRQCARQALGRLGYPPAPLLNGDRGAPRWPNGIVGSMTHCTGYSAAAVAPSAVVACLGVDAEPNAPLPDSVLGVISLPDESAMVVSLLGCSPEIHWDRLLFSIKESVYKCWFPLTGAWLGFDQARITIEPDRGTFQAQLLVPGPLVDGTQLTSFGGLWKATTELLFTAIAVVPKSPRANQT